LPSSFTPLATRSLESAGASPSFATSAQTRLIEPTTSAAASPAFVAALPHGIRVVDTGCHRPLFDAARRGRARRADRSVRFEPEALRRSIERPLAVAPEQIYVIHCGAVGEVPRRAAPLLGQRDAMVAVARAVPAGRDRHATLLRGLEAVHLKSLREHGLTLPDARIRERLALDLELNAQAIAIWLDRVAAQ
jgi:hypothetical protein